MFLDLMGDDFWKDNPASFAHVYTGPLILESFLTNAYTLEAMQNYDKLTRSFRGGFVDMTSMIPPALVLSFHVLHPERTDQIIQYQQLGSNDEPIIRPSQSSEPQLYALPPGTANIHVYSIEWLNDKRVYTLISHYGIGKTIERAEALRLGMTKTSDARTLETLFHDRQDYFVDAEGNVNVTHPEMTKGVFDMSSTPRSLPDFRP